MVFKIHTYSDFTYTSDEYEILKSAGKIALLYHLMLKFHETSTKRQMKNAGIDFGI